jgi:hypothetical protein
MPKARPIGYRVPDRGPKKLTSAQQLEHERLRSDAQRAGITVKPESTVTAGDNKPLPLKEKAAAQAVLNDREHEERRQRAILRPILAETIEVLSSALNMPADIARTYCVFLRHSRRSLLKTDRAWLDLYTNNVSPWQILDKVPPQPRPGAPTFAIAQPSATDYADSNQRVERSIQHLIAAEYARPKAPPWFQIQPWLPRLDFPAGQEPYLDEASALSIGLYLDDREHYKPRLDLLVADTMAELQARYPHLTKREANP